METGILLESGTNELEILEFRVADNYYGINVAKIREIISFQTPTPIPNADSRIEGIFMPRDEIISIIDLAECLHLPKPETPAGDMYIVTNFNKLNTAFHVNGVLGIHRVSWSDIVKPDSTINTAGEGMATGIVRIDGKLIIILDFEKIVSDINPETNHLPVIIFSSLVNEEMKIKGKQLGADAQLSKPEIGQLVSEIDKLVGNVQAE